MTLVPLATLKSAAWRVLLRELRPMHYADLARCCLFDLGLELPDRDFRKVAEDLREKCLQAGAYGMDYLGQPYCLGFIRQWFVGDTLINTDAVRVDLTEDIASRAGGEAALRYPHVLNKYGSPPQRHARRIARGFVVETAVRDVFRDRWPSLYLPPDNDGRYEVPCAHDFKLKTRAHGTLHVDVAGPNADGDWSRSPRKPGADVHIIAAPEGLSVVIHGFMTGSRFTVAAFGPEQTAPITHLFVFLNCEVGRYPYWKLVDALSAAGRRYA